MSDGEEAKLYTGFTVGAVQRLLGESIIAVGFRHCSGREFGFALTEEEASALVAHLLSALQTVDPAHQIKPTIRLQRNIGATSSLEVQAFGLSVRDGNANLSIELANGLALPLVFPASDLKTLKELIERGEKDQR